MLSARSPKRKREAGGSSAWLLGALDGLVSQLSDALAEFFRQDNCRVSLLLEIKGQGIFIFGSRSLLRGKEQVVEAFVSNWEKAKSADLAVVTGLIISLSRREAIHAWFVEVPPNLCSSGPVSVWLADAADAVHSAIQSWRDAYEAAKIRYAKAPPDSWAVGPSNYDSDRRRIAGFATEAIIEFVRDDYLNRMKSLDAGQYLAIPDFLNAALRISTSLEEGSLAYGSLCLYLGEQLDHLPFMARFSIESEPSLARSKHVRKLLRVVSEDRYSLVTDGERVHGILSEVPDNVWLIARFRGRAGEIKLHGNVICTFSWGRFWGTHFTPTSDYLELALERCGLGGRLDQKVVEISSAIVDAAVKKRRGCTIVLDGREEYAPLSGQTLFTRLDVRQGGNLALACGMASVDGAVHVDRKGGILAFGCLLDGLRCDHEDLARGARYNSALRFSAAHGDVAVIVASEDGWVSLFFGGQDMFAELTTGGTEEPIDLSLPPSVDVWLSELDS